MGDILESKIQTRRAVGGLISLLAIIVVFGVASAAFLEINSGQASLVNTSIKINNKQMDRINERLSFDDNTVGVGSAYNINVDNIWSETTTINSYLILDSTSVRSQGYLTDIVKAGQSASISLSETKQITDQSLIFVTDSGKKCVIPLGVTSRIC